MGLTRMAPAANGKTFTPCRLSLKICLNGLLDVAGIEFDEGRTVEVLLEALLETCLIHYAIALSGTKQFGIGAPRPFGGVFDDPGPDHVEIDISETLP